MACGRRGCSGTQNQSPGCFSEGQWCGSGGVGFPRVS